MNKTELKVIYGRNKSFYKKAWVIEHENGTKELLSYKTKVALISKNGTFRRLWDGWSDTTSRHVNEFREQNGMTKLTKKEWMALPVEGQNIRKRLDVWLIDGNGDIKSQNLYDPLDKSKIIRDVEKHFKNEGYEARWIWVKELYDFITNAKDGETYRMNYLKVQCVRC